MRLNFKRGKAYGYIIPVTAIILALTGLLFIYSASCYSAKLDYGNEFYYVEKQAVAFAAGLILMFVGSRVNLEIFVKIKWIILAAGIILCALVFIPGLGVESYGATRWLNLGFMTIQPSELSKFCLMIFLAAYLAENPPVTLKKAVIPLLAGGVICGLIMAEPNMSITVVVGLSTLTVLYVAGLNRKFMAVMCVLLVAAGICLIVVEPYRMERLLAFLDPWANPKDEGYQLIQSYYALGSGGLFGVGLFNSRQKYLFLPFAESDFIFSIIGEETGLFGCLAVMCLFGLFTVIGMKIAKNADSRYKSLLAAGITAVTGIQACINFAVVTGSIPPTGVPLPFVSAGGTALVAFMFSSGLLFNIARNQSN